MNTPQSSRGQALPTVAVALAALAVIVAAAAVLSFRGAGAQPGSGASASPSTPPIVIVPSPSSPSSPAAPATPVPTADPFDDHLLSATGQDVKLTIADQTGSLVAAKSGTPGDGMSVRWHDAIVKQTGPKTIQVTWVALPRDDQVDLGVNAAERPLSLVIVQAGPVPYSDAMGEDRVIILTFDHAVDASQMDVEVLDRTVD